MLPECLFGFPNLQHSTKNATTHMVAIPYVKFSAVKKAKELSPGCTLMDRYCGVNFHGIPSSIVLANVISISLAAQALHKPQQN